MQYGPGFTATFLYYFASVAIIFSLVAAQALGVSATSGFPQQLGLAGGILGGLVGAYFNRSTSFTVPVKKEKPFRNKLNGILTQMGYEQMEAPDKDPTLLIYTRKGASRFLSGKVYVDFGKDSVTIASRAIQIKALKRLIEA